MRRALVLTSESARHPFRASLPPAVFLQDEVEARRSWRLNFDFDMGDMRQFAQAYTACFLAVSVFFA